METKAGFDRAVLVLFVLFVVCAALFVVFRACPVGEWRVRVELGDSAATGAVTEEDGWPDSLLEGEVMDLNAASVKDLERLPGIGAGRAADIVAYRQEHGGFQSVDELDAVKGIGPATLEGIRPYVTVGETAAGGG